MANKALIVSRLVARDRARQRQKTGARRVGRGFSLLELTVVIIIVSLLAVIAIARLLAIQVDAERVTMESVVGTLRSALGMAVAEAIVRQNLRALETLEGTNPMERLAELPTNYLGVFEQPDPASFEDGHWYFDKQAGELVYLVRNTAHFSGGTDNPPRARFAVRLVYADRNGNGRYDSGVDSVEGLRLAPVESYKWIRK